MKTSIEKFREKQSERTLAEPAAASAPGKPVEEATPQPRGNPAQTEHTRAGGLLAPFVGEGFQLRAKNLGAAIVRHPKIAVVLMAGLVSTFPFSLVPFGVWWVWFLNRPPKK